MTELPEEFIPDAPKRIGGRTESDLVVDGGIYPNAPTDADSGPGVCDSCNEEKGNVYYGIDVDTGEPRSICILCRISYTSQNISDPE